MVNKKRLKICFKRKNNNKEVEGINVSQNCYLEVQERKLRVKK